MDTISMVIHCCETCTVIKHACGVVNDGQNINMGRFGRLITLQSTGVLVVTLSLISVSFSISPFLSLLISYPSFVRILTVLYQ